MSCLLRTLCFVHIIGNIVCLLKDKPQNPEANMNISEIISFWNYRSEMYEVVTVDGYILSLYRIPCGKNEPRDSCNTAKPVVYLQHGFTLSASAWIPNPPSSSLGFILADAGFDVWLGNSRGNHYSKKHLYLDPNSNEFWNFSFDEQIKFDIPATIDFIVNKTGQTQIYYMAILRAPFLLMFGEKDMMTRPDDNRLLTFLCHRETMGTVCNNLLTLLFGYNPKNLNESRIDVYTGHLPEGTSVRSIIHFSQGIRTGLFQAYNWNSESLNLQHYNQSTPPIYKVEDMKIQTFIWSGRQDILANPIDVKNLESKTYNLVYHEKINDYNHMDFIIGKDVAEKIYKTIIEFIKKDQSV